jgi:hypothetical protein
LIFVGVELQQSRAIAISDGNLANAEIQIERNNAINENIEIWSRGNSGEPLSQEESIIFNNLVANATIHSFMEYARLMQLDFGEAAASVTAEFAIFLYYNPRARETWLSSEDFRANNFASAPARAEWKNVVHSKLDVLDQQSEKNR